MCFIQSHFKLTNHSRGSVWLDVVLFSWSRWSSGGRRDEAATLTSSKAVRVSDAAAQGVTFFFLAVTVCHWRGLCWDLHANANANGGRCRTDKTGFSFTVYLQKWAHSFLSSTPTAFVFSQVKPNSQSLRQRFALTSLHSQKHLCRQPQTRYLEAAL